MASEHHVEIFSMELDQDPPSPIVPTPLTASHLDSMNLSIDPLTPSNLLVSDDSSGKVSINDEKQVYITYKTSPLSCSNEIFVNTQEAPDEPHIAITNGAPSVIFCHTNGPLVICVYAFIKTAFQVLVEKMSYNFRNKKNYDTVYNVHKMETLVLPCSWQKPRRVYYPHKLVHEDHVEEFLQLCQYHVNEWHPQFEIELRKIEPRIPHTTTGCVQFCIDLLDSFIHKYNLLNSGSI